MLEFGGLRHAFNFGISFPIADDFTGGPWLTAGYGFNWFLSGWRHHRSDPARKAFVIKATLNVLYDWDLGNGAAGTFGVIDNRGKVIHLLDQTADSIFTRKRIISGTSFWRGPLKSSLPASFWPDWLSSWQPVSSMISPVR